MYICMYACTYLFTYIQDMCSKLSSYPLGWELEAKLPLLVRCILRYRLILNPWSPPCSDPVLNIIRHSLVLSCLISNDLDF